MKRFLVLCLVALLTLVFPLACAFATIDSAVLDQELYNGQTFDKSVVISGNTIQVSNCTFNGSVFVTGNNVDFDANVDGNLFVMGNNVTIRGQVSGSVISMSQSVEMFANVKQEVFYAGNTFRLDQSAKLERDMFIACSMATINGTVGRDVYIGSGKANITNMIGGDVKLSVNEIVFSKDASVAGTIKYYSEKQGNLEGNPSLVEKAEWIQTFSTKTQPSLASRIFSAIVKLGFKLVFAIALYLLAMATMSQFKSQAGKIVTENTLRTFLVGFACTVLLPICAVLSFFTIIGLPIGLFALAIWGLLLLCMTAISAYVIMDIVSKQVHLDSPGMRFLLFIGFVIGLELLRWIPFVGIAVGAAINFLGFGVIFSLIFFRKKNDNSMTQKFA